VRVPTVVLAGVERVLARFAVLPRWAAALRGAQPDPDGAQVSRIDKKNSYFIVTLKQGDRVSARIALTADGGLLEAEGIDKAGSELIPYINPPGQQELVWMPCRQSLSRLEPFWRPIGNDAGPFVRVDGRKFKTLTSGGRG
jgi:hypothetical protein